MIYYLGTLSLVGISLVLVGFMIDKYHAAVRDLHFRMDGLECMLGVVNKNSDQDSDSDSDSNSN